MKFHNSSNKWKTKTLRMNHRCTDYIRMEGEEVENVESFVYLGSVLDKLGGTETDIKRRLALARIAFTRLEVRTSGGQANSARRPSCAS